MRLANVNVAIVGAGPAEVTAAKYLAEKGLSVVVFERRLSFGRELVVEECCSTR